MKKAGKEPAERKQDDMKRRKNEECPDTIGAGAIMKKFI